MANFGKLGSKSVVCHVCSKQVQHANHAHKIIYQFLDIGTDDQIPEGEIRSVIYQKHIALCQTYYLMVMLFISWQLG